MASMYRVFGFSARGDNSPIFYYTKSGVVHIYGINGGEVNPVGTTTADGREATESAEGFAWAARKFLEVLKSMVKPILAHSESEGRVFLGKSGLMVFLLLNINRE